VAPWLRGRRRPESAWSWPIENRARVRLLHSPPDVNPHGSPPRREHAYRYHTAAEIEVGLLLLIRLNENPRVAVVAHRMPHPPGRNSVASSPECGASGNVAWRKASHFFQARYRRLTCYIPKRRPAGAV
jgi:hypothetical protein